jgi:FkbM family methyltransferase
MAWTKYFNPIRYIKYFIYQLNKNYFSLRIALRKPFIKSIHFKGEDILFSITSKLELWRANASYKREPITVDWICNYIDDNEIVMDVGANVGAYSLLIAKLKKNSIVYAIEPESSNFYALNRNIISNKLQERIIPLCVALGEQNTINSFFISHSEPGAACHGLDAPISEGVDFIPKHVQGIAEYRLDDLVKELRYKHINHLKVDVDGFEDRLIAGGRKLLNNSNCKTVLIEVYEKTIKTIEKIMNESGFIEHKRNEWPRPSGKAYNILYIKNTE